MQTTLEETDKHVVRLSVEISADEYASDLDRAYRKLAGSVRVPGFRKGKVPRQVIDARIGRDAVFHEFVEGSIPTYYARALREHDLAPITEPEIDITEHGLREGEPFRFTATVEIRPRLTLEPEQYKGVHVEAPSTEPRELEIDEYLDHLRDRFAELEVVSRPARKGDYVLADVRAHVHDQEIPEATRLGFLSELGSEELVPELDRELEGKRKGEILKFNAVLPDGFGPELAGTEVSFQVLIKEVKSKKLPEVDDEFARTASEFDTLQELREDVRSKLREFKVAESRASVRDLVLRSLTDGIDVDLPDRLVDEETEDRIRTARERAERAGTTLEAALSSQGWDELRLRSDARAHATRAIKADLVLEAVARQEDIRVTKEDLEEEIARLGKATGREPKEVRKMLERSGQVTSLAGDIIRSKALDLLVETADVSNEGSAASLDQEPVDEPTPTKEDSDD
jgi:trigger factor